MIIGLCVTIKVLATMMQFKRYVLYYDHMCHTFLRVGVSFPLEMCSMSYSDITCVSEAGGV